MRRVVRLPGTQPSTNPLSPAIRSGGLLFVSGQTAGEVAGFEAQLRAVLQKVGEVLREGGSDYAHVLRCGVYLVDIRMREELNAVYREYFAEDPPARTTIECKLAAPTILVEIDCVAAIVDA